MENMKDYTHGGNVYKAAVELGLSKDKIVDFSANINPFGLSKKGKKAIKRGLKNILNYPDPEYTRLKESLHNHYKVDKNRILLGNGAIELIYSFVNLKKRGTALIPAPGFVEYEKALVRGGWSVKLYNSRHTMNLDGVSVIFLCNPNNPTGESYSEKFLFDLLNKCKDNNVDLVLDEAFIDYSTYPSMVKYLDTFNNLYILKSLTKFYAIPGLRLGALLTSNIDFIEEFNSYKIPWSINSVAEEYIVSGLKDRKYIDRSRKFIQRERVYLYKKLSKIHHLKPYRTQGNYILLKIDKKTDLCKKLKEYGLLIRSCSNYNSLDSSYYRVAVKSRKANNLLVKLLKRILEND